jgi:tRNA(Arg) A34 adenosine deaminase TadA
MMSDISAGGIDPRPFLQRAVELGVAAVRSGRGGPFGAVIVRDGAILGEGANAVLATHDPTAHAEVMAIRDATRRLATFALTDATLYASSEPCPMCLAAIYWARLDAVVYSSGRAAAAAVGFDDAFFYDELARPVADRSLEMRQVELSESAALLGMWRDKADKIRY